MKITELKPYEKNAKKHPEKQIKELMRAIESFGFNQPVVIDKDNEVIVGHCRIEVAKRLGFDEVKIGSARAAKGEKFIPAIRIEELSEAEIKAYRLADNKLNESPWDMSLVIEELKVLEMKGIDVELTGFSVDLIRDAKEDDFDIDKAVEESKNTKIKRGDIFKLGSHRLICGDATDMYDFENLLGKETAKMVFTDPPYNVNYEGVITKRRKILNDKMSDAEFYEFLKSVITNLVEYTKGAFYICMSSSELHNLHRAFIESGCHWQTYIIWAKNHFTLSRSDYQNQMEPVLYGFTEDEAKKVEESEEKNCTDSLPILYGWTEHEWYGGRKQGNVWFFDKPNASKEHPTMKPIALCAKAIKNSSQVGEIVLDVFGGSGSTLIACEQMERKCFMMELDPVYVDVIIKRWEKFTGEKAKILK